MSGKEGNLRGQIAEIKARLAAIEHGYIVSVPISAERYDLIFDTGDKLLKVQVKCLKRDKDKKAFLDLRTRIKGKRKGYCASEVDVIVALDEDNDELWWIDKDKFAGKGTLRLNNGHYFWTKI